jgi:hypothetical protein
MQPSSICGVKFLIEFDLLWYHRRLFSGRKWAIVFVGRRHQPLFYYKGYWNARVAKFLAKSCDRVGCLLRDCRAEIAGEQRIALERLNRRDSLQARWLDSSRQSSVEIAFLSFGNPTVSVGASILRPQLDSLREIGDCPVQIALPKFDRTPVVVGIGKFWIDHDCLIVV